MSNEQTKSEILKKLVKERGNKTEALLYLFSLPPLQYLQQLAEGLSQQEFVNYLSNSHYNNICGIPTGIYETPTDYKKKYEENLRSYYNLKDALYFKMEGRQIVEFKCGGTSNLSYSFALVDREFVNMLVRNISIEEILLSLKNRRVRSIFYSELASSCFAFNNSISAKIQGSELLDHKSSVLFADIVRQEAAQRTNGHITPISVKISQPLLNLLQTGLVYLENESDELEAERFRTFGGKKFELLRKPNRESKKMKDIFDGQKFYVKSSSLYQSNSKSNLESKKLWN